MKVLDISVWTGPGCQMSDVLMVHNKKRNKHIFSPKPLTIWRQYIMYYICVLLLNSYLYLCGNTLLEGRKDISSNFSLFRPAAGSSVCYNQEGNIPLHAASNCPLVKHLRTKLCQKPCRCSCCSADVHLSLAWLCLDALDQPQCWWYSWTLHISLPASPGRSLLWFSGAKEPWIFSQLVEKKRMWFMPLFTACCGDINRRWWKREWVYLHSTYVAMS